MFFTSGLLADHVVVAELGRLFAAIEEFVSVVAVTLKSSFS